MTDHSDLIAELRGSRTPGAELLCLRAASALSSQSLSLSEAREETERLKGLVAGIRETPARTSLIRQETAAVFRGGGRRFFTRKAAERAEAKAAACSGTRSSRNGWPTSAYQVAPFTWVALMIWKKLRPNAPKPKRNTIRNSQTRAELGSHRHEQS